MGQTKRWIGGAVGLIVAVSALGACGGTGDEATSRSGSADSAGGGSAALKAELAKGPAAGTQLQDRQVVYQGSLTIRVPDAEKAADRALRFADDVDGYLGQQDSQLEGEREVKVTLRVPAEDFDDVMAKAAELGTVQARSVDSDDVTDQVVDLEGRLENAQASSERLRELLAKAENIDNIAVLEDRLTQRESEIEQISGQLEVIGNDVQFATISLTLTEKDAPAVSDDLPAPLDALRAGFVTLVSVLVVLLAAVAFALPFVPFLLVGWFGIRAWRRRHPKPPPPRFEPSP
ncbi:MAG: lipoprotein, partial [Ilumatobacteraceae bacterium]|nr:lipoprotein [Ilumatobacteraceae bacterium]